MTTATAPSLTDWKETFKLLRELSKSGIVALVLISVLGGYLIGHSPEAPLNVSEMFLTLFGILFLASGSSALNQLQERHLDASMPRTSKRPLPSGRITPQGALIFVTASVLLGLSILASLSLTLFGLGLLALFSYNVLYTLWWKKHWAYAAVPGAIPGALPILMGYVAASHRLLSPAGTYLFFILFYWQMPHFWVLALRFRKDYELGQFPTLPVARGEGVTVFQIGLWCLCYVALALVAPFFLRVGSIYLLIALPVCGMLLWELRGFTREFARDSGDPQSKGWLRFFLWVNFSLILFIGAAALDVWAVNLMTPYWTR